MKFNIRNRYRKRSQHLDQNSRPSRVSPTAFRWIGAIACATVFGLSVSGVADFPLPGDIHLFSKHSSLRPSGLQILRPSKDIESKRADHSHWLKLLEGVDVAALKSTVESLIAIPDRSTRSPGIQAATQLIASQFVAMGYVPSRQCFGRNAHGELCNIIARKEAAVSSSQTVVVMAHFDSVGYSRAGADDNASGTSGLLEIARIIANTKTSTHVVFVASNGEEDGLDGSRFYVKDLQTKRQLSDVKLAVVMDMIGYNTGRVDIETFAAHRALGQKFIDDLPQYVALPPRLIIPGWGSDHISFLDLGVPSFLIIDDTDTRTPCYHLACDTADTLDYPYFRQMVQVSLLAVAQAAGVDLPQ